MGETDAAGTAPRVVRYNEWLREGYAWRGRIEGGPAFGADVSIIFFESDIVGDGARLHVHDYDEVFIVRDGRARFEVGGVVLEAAAGDVVFGPRGVPHSFANIGPGRLATIDIHLSERVAQTDLA